MDIVVKALSLRLKKIFSPYRINFEGMEPEKFVRIINGVFDEYESMLADAIDFDARFQEFNRDRHKFIDSI